MTTHNHYELWRHRIAAYRGSGQTAKEWCKQNQINIHTLKYWITKINRSNKNEKADEAIATETQWIQYSLRPLEPGMPAELPKITVRAGAFTVEVPTDFNKELLKDILGVCLSLC